MRVWVIAARRCWGSEVAFAEGADLGRHVGRMYSAWSDVVVDEVQPAVVGQRQFAVKGVNPAFPNTVDSTDIQFKLIEVMS